MKHLKLFLLGIVALVAFTACDKEDGPVCILPAETCWPCAILNNGNWGANDACLTVFEHTTDYNKDHIFVKTNSMQLGDLGQDIVRVGNEYFIAVNGSKTIFVTDDHFKVKNQVNAEVDGWPLSPRYFCYVESLGKVYVTYYEGYLGEIDLKTYDVRTTKVGLNPEGVDYAKGKLYVANSGGLNYENGYDNTVSVVDAATFREEKKLTVNVNPQMVIADKAQETIYVNSFGNYGDVPAKLQSITLSTGEVKDLDYTDVKGIARHDYSNILYVVTGSYDENWQVQGTVNVFNMTDKAMLEKPLAENIKNYYSISTAYDFVYVGTSDYKTNGDVYVYDKMGTELKKVDAQGLNPIKVVPVPNWLVGSL